VVPAFIIGPESEDETQLTRQQIKEKEERADRHRARALEHHEFYRQHEEVKSRIQEHQRRLAEQAETEKKKMEAEHLNHNVVARMQSLTLAHAAEEAKFAEILKAKAEAMAKQQIGNKAKQRGVGELQQSAGEYRSFVAEAAASRLAEGLAIVRPQNIPNTYRTTDDSDSEDYKHGPKVSQKKRLRCFSPHATSAYDTTADVRYATPIHMIAQKMCVDRAEKRVLHQLKKELAEEGIFVEKENEGLGDGEDWEVVPSKGEDLEGWETV
jgi:hypothetical protein